MRKPNKEEIMNQLKITKGQLNANILSNDKEEDIDVCVICCESLDGKD